MTTFSWLRAYRKEFYEEQEREQEAAVGSFFFVESTNWNAVETLRNIARGFFFTGGQGGRGSSANWETVRWPTSSSDPHPKSSQVEVVSIHFQG